MRRTAAAGHSSWSPFRYSAFAVVWTATLVSNIGGWMYSSSSAWLMTTLDPDPLLVSLVQVAASLPVFLFALPAGALADILDRRRFLIGAESYIAVVSIVFAALVWLHVITPVTLLIFVFLIETGSAITSPPWQAVVPQLVPREELAPAISMNSVGVNISRALGPAVGGVLTAVWGLALPFWINAFSNLGVIGALAWWRAPRERTHLPAERLASAIRTGLRHARHNQHLRATLVRAVAFFAFASCYWALLPVVSRNQVGGGAIVGSARNLGVALLACFSAGLSWIAVLPSLNVSAQVALPEWVRGRGLAIYVTVFFGAMTLGSAIWGQLARMGGAPLAHWVAAAGALVCIPLTWRWKLQTGAGVDLSPSMHWPVPIVKRPIEDDSGPVLVLIDYRIDNAQREPFLAALEHLGHERQRDGAYAWGVFEDAAEPGHYAETFLVESWLEHLRQHERVTEADRATQARLHAYLKAPVRTTHLITATRKTSN